MAEKSTKSISRIKGFLKPHEHWLGPANKLDYLIRRWAIPDHPSNVGRMPLSNSLTACPTEAAAQNAPSGQRHLLTDVKAGIGQYLAAEYDLAQPLPDRLAALLRKVDQPLPIAL
jgi:hypothetical protein